MSQAATQSPEMSQAVTGISLPGMGVVPKEVPLEGAYAPGVPGVRGWKTHFRKPEGWGA